MKKITFPLKLDMKGSDVSDLHEALGLLISKAIIMQNDETGRKKLYSLSRGERAGQVYGEVTKRMVSVFQEEERLEVTGEVDEKTANALNRVLDEIGSTSEGEPEYVVKGIINFYDGFPASGIYVSAFDRDLRKEQLLGKSQTDKLGCYEISYSSNQFIKDEHESADLVVKAFAADGTILVASSVLFNAPIKTVVDLTIPAEVLLPPTLFEKINLALTPLLEGLKVEELEEDKQYQDISFLAGETGFEKDTLARFVLAHNLTDKGIRPEFWFVLLGGSFYKFTENQSLSEQLSAVLDSLQSLNSDSLHKKFVIAFNQREIPEAFKENVGGWIDNEFLPLVAKLLVNESKEPIFVKLALEHAGIKIKEMQENFVKNFNNYGALTPKLEKDLENDQFFKKEEIPGLVSDLNTSFKLAELTQGDFSVVKMIKDTFGFRKPEQIRTLAKMSEEEWVKLISDKHTSGEIILPFGDELVSDLKIPSADIYGKTLERQFRETFPTTAFVGGLNRALSTLIVKGLNRAQDLSKFLEKHETFELLNTNIDEFMKNSLHPDFQSLSEDEDFRLELKAAQRVFKLVPTFEATNILLADGLHSAQKIYSLGQDEFIRRYGNKAGFDAASARLAWNRAADTHAAVLTILADLNALGARALPQVLKNGNEAVSTFPNWNNLFKTGDLCECEDCRSVLGPAAYFADLLMFLKNRNSTKSNSSGFVNVKDILLSRRPDLGYLELSCDNALVSLPYIDVVCEVLEDAIDNWPGKECENDLELIGLSAISPTSSGKSDLLRALRNAFFDKVNVNKEKIKLGKDFSLSKVNSLQPDQWIVHSDNVTYLLKKKTSSPNFFAKILRNTKTNAAELRAYPQYVNPKVYEKLCHEKYPFVLPFDLFAEEVRIEFQKINLKRWNLMSTFQGLGEPYNTKDIDIAAEYFGISSNADDLTHGLTDEMSLILVADPTVDGQKAIWGETDDDWLDKVGNVKNFLKKTGLEYNELLALLDLRFINAGDIYIDNLNPTCDTDQKVIKVLDAAKLDRIHRFLRMWRKLKDWKMWELDLVIRNPNIGNELMDKTFLVNLFYFSLVKNKLGDKTTVEQVSALFDNLNTETHFTKLHKKREDALYQNLFLNKRLIQPLNPAFGINTADNEIIDFEDPLTGKPVEDHETGLPMKSKISDHQTVILAALGIREADLSLLKEFAKKGSVESYINDKLILKNLSFLWRHTWLPKQLKFKIDEWKVLLKFLQEDPQKDLQKDPMSFANPKAALEFLEKVDYLKASGFDLDELNWLLTADRSSKATIKEPEVARFLTSLRKDLQAIKEENNSQYAFLTNTPLTDTDSLTALLNSLLQKLNMDEITTQFFIATLRNEASQETIINGLHQDFDFPKDIKDYIHIRYNKSKSTLNFTGLMTSAEKTTLLNSPSLAGITGIAAYQAAIEELFIKPRLAIKFYDPIFTEPLASLPEGVDFKTLGKISQKISYDPEQLLLRFTGILSKDDKNALDSLSNDNNYRIAVNSIFIQPTQDVIPPERIWLLDSDLLFPLKDNLGKNLVTAIEKALLYLSKTLSEGTVIQQSSTQLGLTEALTRYLLTHYALLHGKKATDKPETLMTNLVHTFADTTGGVDYATLKNTFDDLFWASRVAAILKKWKITLAELKKINSLTATAQLMDFLTLPLDDTGSMSPGSMSLIDLFLRTSRLIRLRDSLPETRITLLEVLDKLNTAKYEAKDFAADVERLNEAWLASDVQSLIKSLDHPADYLLVENWERLRQAFYFIDNLNASAGTVKKFAAPTMTYEHAQDLKNLLRSKIGAETWLTLSTEIQDVLRKRKCDALAAYLLIKKRPEDAPSGKWEDINDLYAYYLLDVEMSSCLLTSRLVQGTGSVQLFVQRCFMGLETDVKVKADGDDGDNAWRWWKWMRKYRVWEANRKVFLWPENWIEPELKKDRSSFFKDMENELLQNDINQYTVETAFQNYLEKLDGVAQLEIAGFYQEDDGEEAIIHVFGRTQGAEPHIYYYRQYDYRFWTPWEKVDLDIQGDYLVPAVLNKRLFLFWPVFTEIPDEDENSKVDVPSPGAKDVSVDKAKKRLKLQMAMSEYRQGKWTPKKISKDFDKTSNTYSVEIVKDKYHFIPLDMSDNGGRFQLIYEGSEGENCPRLAELTGAFDFVGCKGVPEKASPLNFKYIPSVRPVSESTGDLTSFMKWVEKTQRSNTNNDDFALEYYPDTSYSRNCVILLQTPGIFKMMPPWQLSYFDKLRFEESLWYLSINKNKINMANIQPILTLGTWLPFFYNDRKRTFFVLPLREEGESILTKYHNYPDAKKYFISLENSYTGIAKNVVDNLLFPIYNSSTDRRKILEEIQSYFPREYFPDEVITSQCTDDQIKSLLNRMLMRLSHSILAERLFNEFKVNRFHFKSYYHPYVCNFIRLVCNPLKGIPALMARETQLMNTEFRFGQVYQPTSYVLKGSCPLSATPSIPEDCYCYPQEEVDFLPDGSYSCYNWELFFHAPLLIANSLSKNQCFEEARDWYHFIFNPLGVESPMPGSPTMSKYWITKPFFETTDSQYVQQRIDNILRMLAGDTSIPSNKRLPGCFSVQKDLEKQVLDWRNNPFEPHRIASYRTVAYQKTIVMKYLDNLIAWGDYLFEQDSMESINEATQLYIMAAEILGPRPKEVPPQTKPPLESFNELEDKFGTFSTPMVQVENLVPPMPGNGSGSKNLAPLPTLYFCIPENDIMLNYWDKVADRLYKIRHCMNIEGAVRQPALFEPPIDPGALVKAIAGGLDISSALADLNAPLPLYRFNVILQKANEVCSDVKALGSALLSALEKKDAEALSLLRQGQEIKLLEAVKAVKEQQIDEVKTNLEGVKKSRELAVIKEKYYESREFMNSWEIGAALLNAYSIEIDAGIAIGYTAAGGLKLIPNFIMGGSGFGGSPHAVVETGGKSAGDSAEDLVKTLESITKCMDKMASLASTMSSYKRRWEEWSFQKDLAIKEIEQLDKQIVASELRISIAEKELENHVIQMENAKATDEFMRSKYTNQELYQWQVGQISGVYFQSYKLAYDLAKRAERCFRFELGLQDSSYINFGYWDSLKKGLLSGEKLQYDLRRLETAYLEKNRREFELTKHVSLILLDPLSLVKLRETGRCFFQIPEELFDLDYPGHYFRRIKSVSVTLPCVVGPYTTISCTLRLLKNSIRINTAKGENDYPRNIDENGLPADDIRFIENNIPVKAIAASNAQNDSGMFELSFRDERYLPFEGAGAISQWSLELFSGPENSDFGKSLRQFDYSTISDAIIHIKYTAKEDAGEFKNRAIIHLREYFKETPMLRIFNLRQEFPSQWYRFLNPNDSGDGNVFELDMSSTLFSFKDEGKKLKVNTLYLLARCTDMGDYSIVMEPPLTSSDTLKLVFSDQYGGLHYSKKDVSALGIEIVLTNPVVKWKLIMTRPDGKNLQEDPVVKKVIEVEDLFLVLEYEWE